MPIKNMKTMPYLGGTATRYYFSDGYSLSVIRHAFSYGGKHGLFEVAVFDSLGNIDENDSVIVNGLMGWLSEENVSSLIDQFAEKH